MPTYGHSRTSSEETTSSGASYQLILEHILSYPGTYEIPLRTMYTLNCAPRAQPLPSTINRASASSNASSPTSSHFSMSDAHSATAQFTSSLMAQISQLPSQPCSLPPSFITSFLHKCFPPLLQHVDFAQALTSLDYLRDLENRRRRELQSAFKKLGIERELSESELAAKHPLLSNWVQEIGEKDKRADSLYSGLYVALRRWILVNEMSLEPFNKHNCHAMLNTLYPPVVATPPTSRLPTSVLMQQRDGFFKYIKSVENKSPAVLNNLIQQNKKPGDATGWPEVHRTLERYLILVNSMIRECQDMISHDYARFLGDEENEKRKGRKTDSGVSFGSSDKRTSSGSTANTVSSASTANTSLRSSRSVGSHKPLPPSPEDEVTVTGKSGTALEKIARELRRFRSKNKIEVFEAVKEEDTDSKPIKPKSLRKMKSLGALSDMRRGNFSSTSVNAGRAHEVPAFNMEEMRRQRMAYDARVHKV